MHYCLLGETGWLGCCLCRRCRLAGRVQNAKEDTFLVHGSEGIMRKIFGNVIEEMPMKLSNLSAPALLLFDLVSLLSVLL
jgi:hypothetical protein